jgi:hypothetical protein
MWRHRTHQLLLEHTSDDVFGYELNLCYELNLYATN